MTTKKEIVSTLLIENTGIVCGYQSHLDVEEYYESITLPKKLSTTEFIELVDVEVQKGYLKQLREGRTKRMTATDFLMVSDFPYPSIEIKTAWRNYRQALRDLPATNSTVQLDEEMEYFVVTWPTAPIWPANVV
jgi:hypothetical protein